MENSLHTNKSNGTIEETTVKGFCAVRKQTSFERNMLMEVTRVGEDGITMHGNLYKDFNNTLYSFPNSFIVYLYKYTILFIRLDKYWFAYYYMYTFKYLSRRHTVLSLIIYQMEH